MRLIALLSLIIVCGPFFVVGSSIGLSDESESSSSTSASRESRQKGYRQLEAEKTDKMKDDQEKGEKEEIQEITEKGDDNKIVEKEKEENKKEDKKEDKEELFSSFIKEENKDENKKEDKEKEEKEKQYGDIADTSIDMSAFDYKDSVASEPEDQRIGGSDPQEIESGDKLVRAAAKNDMKEVKSLLESGVNVDTPGRLSFRGKPQSGPRLPVPRIWKGRPRRVQPQKEAAYRLSIVLPDPHHMRKPWEPTTALIEASRRKHLKMMKFLIDKEADPNKCLQGECPLCAIVSGRFFIRVNDTESNRDIKAMKILKDAGADLDTKCSRAEKPLIFMAAKNSLRLLKELLKMGADPQVKDSNYGQDTLLQTVIRSKRYHYGSPEEVLEAVKAIIKRDPEAVNRTNRFNRTALLSVLRYGGSQEETLEIVKVLVQNGADVNTVDDRGNTPLMRAASGNNKENTLEIVKFLVQNGADVNAIDKMGFTPLIHAADGNNPAVVKLLLDKNADVNVQNKYQETPLMMLLKARNTTNSMDIAKMLLEKGADPNAQMDKLDYGDGSDSGGTPQTVSIFDQAKKMLRDRKERERKAKEESEKMQKMVQLLEQYADKKGF